MNKPHKHAELIKAWADGDEIEYKSKAGIWCGMSFPSWDKHTEYRIKPEQKPDVETLYWCHAHSFVLEVARCKLEPKLKLTFDGETGELKSAEVLK